MFLSLEKNLSIEAFVGKGIIDEFRKLRIREVTSRGIEVGRKTSV